MDDRLSRKTKIIAEIGENHHGDWQMAARLIELAAENGADIVKFQSYLGSDFPPDDPEYEWFQRVALPDEKHFEFKALAEKLGIKFLSAPFSSERAQFLIEDLGCDMIKIASSALKNYAMLDLINDHAATVKTVIVSTGMSRLDDIYPTLERLGSIETISILHCVTQYPARPDQINLRSIPTLIEAFPVHTIGYSDHLPGIQACLGAVALGAEILEKHFTFNRLMPGSDHAGSMEPFELGMLCRQVEELEQMLGSAEKEPVAEELSFRDSVWQRFTQ